MKRMLHALAAATMLAFAGCSEKSPKAIAPQFSEEAYATLRKGLNAELPKDYLDFLRSYRGTPPDADFYWVVPQDWGSGIDQFYLMLPGEHPSSLLQILKWEGLPIKPGLLPIGGDGAFGYLLISTRPKDFGTVHFCCTWSEDGKPTFTRVRDTGKSRTRSRSFWASSMRRQKNERVEEFALLDAP